MNAVPACFDSSLPFEILFVDSLMNFMISFVACDDFSASFRTSSAATENSNPCSSALATSISVLNSDL